MNNEKKPDERVVLIHGFSREETMKILKAVKSKVSDPAGVAFSMTTSTNIEWKIKDLVNEVREEHEYLRANPPGKSGSSATPGAFGKSS
ncbi:MAG: DUF3783 domain-containing protein [Spirochaetales bacterium]|nr:DUF3783 domain-containing protein [Spirochaetales bacterium]